jgi:hypothetical protein
MIWSVGGFRRMGQFSIRKAEEHGDVREGCGITL